jgi:hypothetical protein
MFIITQRRASEWGCGGCMRDHPMLIRWSTRHLCLIRHSQSTCSISPRKTLPTTPSCRPLHQFIDR